MSTPSPAPAAPRQLSLWLGALAALTLTAVLLFGIFEGALRLWWPQDMRTIGGARAIRDADPEVDYVYRPGVHVVVRCPEYTEDIRINADGMRDEDVHPRPKPANVYRVLVVGDSFTFGDGADYDDVWTVVAERALAARGIKVDFVKAGVEGSDTRREFLNIRKLSPQFQPDMVLMAFLPNDLFTNEPLGRAAAGGEAGERTHQISLQSITLLQRLLFRNDRVYTMLYNMTARRQYFTEPPNPIVAEQYRVTEDLLRQTAEYARSRRMRFTVFSLPQYYQVIFKSHGMRAPGIDVDAVDRRLGAFAVANGFDWLPALDPLVDDYRRNRTDLYHRFDGHLAPRGNRVAATWLAGEFARRYAADVTTVMDRPANPPQNQ